MKDELEDKYWLLKAMELYGGSFVRALADAMRAADHINYSKLVNAFPEYIARYDEMGKQLKEKHV